MIARPPGRAAWFCLALFAALGTARAETKTIARCGAGFLEEVDGYRVLHVKGTHYEMGFQQGALLREDIRENIHYLFDVKAKELKVDVAGLSLLNPKRAIAGIAARQRKFIPERFFDELQGVADGAGLDVQDVIVANFIPELFHCSGFALGRSTTKDGRVYHGRVLDYGCDWRLQEHAILTVAEPAGRTPFVNVTYAGFVGSVTGMNAEKVSIGEMGGKGLGHWDGVPMSFLMRMVLEDAKSLDDAVAIFRDNPRTCEYYFVVADGETGKAVGMEASWDVFSVIAMGEAHPKLPVAIADAVVLSAGDRYTELARRVQEGRGGFDADSARKLMDRPVAMKSNLHNVLFETDTGRFWVANADKEGRPAADQPYHAFDLKSLMADRADESAPSLQAPRRAARAGEPAAVR
ncbi:C45 family autoproteolytic acyltransferase/hydolase [Paludisphaera mucosa]|uniref:C45 family autoproteolytic acyltransferase/hydrolase n=1 Tax=Paludisphaera mucosa TaxID=3030827 RepID=A0ABT6F410_9BACT|nr:C45 family peptidase [Paludisphaera mucosa]MDG3002296.1 C45 family autoproteolytic acyltransferase/hydrolase [Paludisphaera mucosa]